MRFDYNRLPIKTLSIEKVGYARRMFLLKTSIDIDLYIHVELGLTEAYTNLRFQFLTGEVQEKKYYEMFSREDTTIKIKEFLAKNNIDLSYEFQYYIQETLNK